MTQGYIFLGVDDYDSAENIKHAYALSLSLKLVDPTRETCVVVNKFADVPSRYEEGFDYIVELPFGRTEVNHHDMYIDLWQLYYCTPFDESMFVDTYTLCVDNIDNLWDIAVLDDLVFPEAVNYRNESYIDERFDIQEKNNIMQFDTKLIYFKQSEKSADFFKMATPVFKYWRDSYRECLGESRPEDFNYNVLLNLVGNLLCDHITIAKWFTYRDITINFSTNDEWIENLNIWYTKDLTLKVNNYNQVGFVHYGQPAVLTASILNKLNDYYNKH